MYTLSGLVDKTNGWGVADDTRNMLQTMERYGEASWFGLGDKDLATHLLRTQWLREGYSLTEVIERLRTHLGIQHRILPMTDQPVATKVDTVEHGELDFQSYFVRFRWQPVVQSLRLEGIEEAALNSVLRDALAQADAILIGPSNPWLSINPILAVPGMREALLARDVPRVAITPIIGGNAVKGPAAKLMAELGYPQSAQTVADYYQPIINGFVYDERDRALQIDQLRTVMFDTLMQNESDRIRLAQAVLNWIGEWN